MARQINFIEAAKNRCFIDGLEAIEKRINLLVRLMLGVALSKIRS